MNLDIYTVNGKKIMIIKKWNRSLAASPIVIKILVATCLLCQISCSQHVNVGTEPGLDDTPAYLQDIIISGAEDNTKIKILTSKPVKYKLNSIAAPPREVVDLYPPVLNPFNTPLPVSTSLISQIDIAKHDRDGNPFSRIIFKLKRSVAFAASTDPSGENTIILSVVKPHKRTSGSSTSGSAPPQERPSMHPPTAEISKKIRDKTEMPEHIGPMMVIRRLDITRDGVEIAVNGVDEKFRTFKMKGPQRLVLDVFGASTSVKSRIVPVNRFGITNIRLGTYPDKVRLVFDASRKIFPDYRIEVESHCMKVLFVKE